MTKLCSTIMLLACTVAAGAAEADFVVKPEKIAPPEGLHNSIKSLLSDEAVRIEGANGTHCTLWFRKEVPAQATPEQMTNGLTYREIPKTTLIGAIELPEKWIDFRKQEIPKGLYTLRLGFQPQNGDHEGTAPHTEFCLLAPAFMDQKPDPMEMKALIEMSATLTGSAHPSVMLLYPNFKAADEPKMVGKGKGIWVVNVKRAVRSGDQRGTIGFGFTVAGHTME